MRTLPKSQFLVRKEGSPERCEICHQSDQFDPQTGRCQRCKGFSPKPVANFDPQKIQLPKRLQTFLDEELTTPEPLLWVGTPGVVHVVGGTVVTIGVAFLALCLTLYTWWQGNELWSLGIFLCFLILCCAGLYWWQGKNTLYVVTPKRILILERFWRKKITTYTREQVKRLIRKQKFDGSGDLIFEDFSTSNGGSQVIGFIGIDQVQNVEEIIRQNFLARDKQS